MLEDPYDGVYQLAHNPLLALAFCGKEIDIIQASKDFLIKKKIS